MGRYPLGRWRSNLVRVAIWVRVVLDYGRAICSWIVQAIVRDGCASGGVFILLISGVLEKAVKLV